jgi:hypothetical protein
VRKSIVWTPGPSVQKTITPVWLGRNPLPLIVGLAYVPPTRPRRRDVT